MRLDTWIKRIWARKNRISRISTVIISRIFTYPPPLNQKEKTSWTWKTSLLFVHRATSKWSQSRDPSSERKGYLPVPAVIVNGFQRMSLRPLRIIVSSVSKKIVAPVITVSMESLLPWGFNQQKTFHYQIMRSFLHRDGLFYFMTINQKGDCVWFNYQRQTR